MKLIISCLISIFVLFYGSSGFSETRLPHRLIQNTKRAIQEKAVAGYDVSEAIRLERESKKVFLSGDTEKGIVLLERAMEAVRSAGRKDDRFQREETASQTRMHTSISSYVMLDELPLGVNKEKVIATVAVPGFNSGDLVQNKNQLYESRILPVTNGTVSISLDDRPVILESYPLDKLTLEDDSSSDSPFGITESIGPVWEYDQMKTLGVKWVRQGGFHGLHWKEYKKEPDRIWSRLDKIYGPAEEKGFSQIVILKTAERPDDIVAFRSFLKKAVKRYDYVKVWEIEQELENEWKDSLENYAVYLKTAYEVIKEANPKANVAFASLAGPWEISKTLPPVLRKLAEIEPHDNKRYFDIIPLHWSGKGEDRTYKRQGNWEFKDTIADIRKLLSPTQYHDVPIWISAISFNDGHATFRMNLKRSERAQAIELVKMFVYPLANDISKIFWITLTERHKAFAHVKGKGATVDYYDLVGLINNPKNDGKSYKKLSYYSYKLLAEKLKGTDWQHIETILDGKDNIYAYRFPKTNNSAAVYVVWRDNSN